MVWFEMRELVPMLGVGVTIIVESVAELVKLRVTVVGVALVADVDMVDPPEIEKRPEKLTWSPWLIWRA